MGWLFILSDLQRKFSFQLFCMDSSVKSCQRSKFEFYQFCLIPTYHQEI